MKSWEWWQLLALTGGARRLQTFLPSGRGLEGRRLGPRPAMILNAGSNRYTEIVEGPGSMPIHTGVCPGTRRTISTRSGFLDFMFLTKLNLVEPPGT
jgi:hypothetical protein